MTPCRTCQRAEMTRFERVRDDLAGLLGLGQTRRVLAAYGSSLIVLSQGWQEYHTQRFAETGDDIELRRALRHVRL